MSTEPTKRDVVVTRVFDAPVEQVWKAWVATCQNSESFNKLFESLK